MARHVERDNAGGIAWLAARDGDVELGVAGTLTREEDRAVEPDSLFRIASMTKPITAVAALILVEECRLRLDDPIDDLLPEMASRPVLVDGRGDLDGETVPATRPITVDDLLTFRLGLGMDFSAPWPWPVMDAMDALDLGSGPPHPQVPPEPDEWIRRLSTLPLLYQPGERWLYNTGSDVLGVLVRRAAGQPLEVFLRERLFEPLGMVDTAFHVEQPDRLGASLRGRSGRRSSHALRLARRRSGRRRRRSRQRPAAWCRRSTTCTRSAACCSPRDGCPTGRG